MRKTLITTGLRFNRMDAQRYANASGKTLASYALVDEGAMKGIIHCMTHAREWVAHPAKDGTFEKYKDIVDPETGSRVPWSAVKELDICRPGIGLLLDPKDLDIHKETGGIVVLPESVVILKNYIHTDGRYIWRGFGKVDETTKIPFEVPEKLWNKLPEALKRWFVGIAGIGVRSIARDGYVGHSNVFICRAYNGKLDVHADCHPDDVLAVAFEEPAARKASAQKAGAPSKQPSRKE
ncbi:MAG: hypothetical protein PHS02_03245 [Candidatus ainarchaeum sp.]|nr:hypothetical protein [Candidatus ainarchaeum sp.]